MNIGDLIIISPGEKRYKIDNKSSETPLCDIIDQKENENYEGFIEEISSSGKYKIRITKKDEL